MATALVSGIAGIPSLATLAFVFSLPFCDNSPELMEMCDVKTYLIEDADPNGPFGAKEVGQGPLLPVPPAVANAVYDAVGVRIDEVPIMPEKVLKALRVKAKGGDGRYGPDSVPAVDWPVPMSVLTPKEGGDAHEMPRVTVHS